MSLPAAAGGGAVDVGRTPAGAGARTPAGLAAIPPRVPDSMRLVTYNVRHGLGPDGTVDLKRYARSVAALDADILALQEVERHRTRSDGADLTSIAADRMGAQDWHFAPTLREVLGLMVRAGRPGIGARRIALPSYGIGLVSRFPITAWQRLDLPRLPARERVRRAARGVNVHRGMSPADIRSAVVRGAVKLKDEPRAAIAARVHTPAGPLTVVATHLTATASATEEQLRALARACDRLPGPFVVLGDLNLRDAAPARITGWTPLATARTYPVGRPERQIDHILAGPGRSAGGAPGDAGPVGEAVGDAGHVGGPIAVGPAVAVDTGLSDHRALVVDVRLGGLAGE